MKDRIKNGANLLESHVFQMDFLNDDFADKCPQDLLEIINNPEKRKKLVIYINPPYAEATTATTVTGSGENKAKVAISNKTYERYKNLIGNASNELFAQFFIRIYQEIPDCWLGEFSKLKILQSSNFATFRRVFLADLKKMFVVPANTFDNVKGQFPIGFMIWNCAEKKEFLSKQSDVYDKNAVELASKIFYTLDENKGTINKWMSQFNYNGSKLANLVSCPPDYQHNGQLAILSIPQKRYCIDITACNISYFCIYFSVRHCMEATWLNDRDQFLYPNDDWKEDRIFQSDCLAFTLFHGQNRITSEQGINNWIPFTEKEVEPKNNFASHFMTDYIKENHIEFSSTAQAVFAAGRELWRYYHQQPNSNPNASFYDIRAHFQGRDSSGKMNKDSKDEKYNQFIANLRLAMKNLAEEIKPKVYEYGFLKI